jgi:SAM-dependent methyltransferase
MIFEYRGRLYPELVKHGNGCQYVTPIALKFCKGRGLDVGAGAWPLPGAEPIDLKYGNEAMELPHGPFDYVFSSHCLEHLPNPVAALEHWRSRIKPGGVLFLYLPHPYMEYWLPQNCRKHLHSWMPKQMAQIVRDLGFVDVIHSERDLAYGFSVVGFNG